MTAFTEAQQLALGIVPQVLSFISLIAGLYTVITILKNRESLLARMYHRLMFAVAINVVFLSIRTLFVFFAVPVGTPDSPLARGNTQTCSTTGFLYHFFFLAVLSYYCALSIYSYVAIQNNFQDEKYSWIEKWIHLGVYVFPVGSGLYLLSIDAFNYIGQGCYIASVPLGCGNDSGVVCTRGPQNIGQIQWIFGAAPIIVTMVLSAVVMTVLYFKVKRKTNSKNRKEQCCQPPVQETSATIDAKKVGRQGFIYVSVLYWSYIFTFVNVTAVFAFGVRSFALQLLAQNERLLGLYITMAYRFFSRDHRKGQDGPKSDRTTADPSDGDITDAIQETGTSRHGRRQTPDQNCSFSIFDGIAC
mmetsp:Transcript_30959/g.74775  ORF Transcript_30959/g.74775 Transcript_30959/m.74775 type:complete len:359 (+) Transcript_30959:340-1416(+)